MANPFYTLDQIKEANARAGGHWFEPGALRFFASRISDRVHCGPGGIFFVSSEQFRSSRGNGPRLYSVREFHPDTGRVETVGEFQAYKSGRAAHAAAAEMARGKD